MKSIWEKVAETEQAGMDSAVDFPTDSRMHISLNVSNLEESAKFYRVLLDQNPSKVREGYVKFESQEPAVNLTLNDFPNETSTDGHFGIQVKNTEIVMADYDRFKASGFKIITEDDIECCYAVQSKIWVADPDGNRWEIFVTTAPEAEEGCGPECICHQEFDRSYVVEDK